MVRQNLTGFVRASGCVVIVGCAHATTFVKLVLVDYVDHALEAALGARATVVVDDSQSLTIGPWLAKLGMPPKPALRMSPGKYVCKCQ